MLTADGSSSSGSPSGSSSGEDREDLEAEEKLAAAVLVTGGDDDRSAGVGIAAELAQEGGGRGGGGGGGSGVPRSVHTLLPREWPRRSLPRARPAVGGRRGGAGARPRSMGTFLRSSWGAHRPVESRESRASRKVGYDYVALDEEPGVGEAGAGAGAGVDVGTRGAGTLHEQSISAGGAHPSDPPAAVSNSAGQLLVASPSVDAGSGDALSEFVVHGQAQSRRVRRVWHALRRARRRLSNLHVRVAIAFLRTALLMYAVCLSAVAILLSCVSIPTSTKLALFYDASVPCAFGGWQSPVIALALLLFCSPLGLIYLQHRAEREVHRRGDRKERGVLRVLLENQGGLSKAALLRGVHAELAWPFKPKLFLWESILLIQRLLFVVVYAFQQQQLVQRAVMMALLAVGCLVVHVYRRPFRQRHLNVYQSALLCLLVFVTIWNVPRAINVRSSSTSVVANALLRSDVSDAVYFMVLLVPVLFASLHLMLSYCFYWSRRRRLARYKEERTRRV